MRRRKLLVAGGAGCSGRGWGAVVLWPGQSHVTEENFSRIRQGCSETDVEQILGEPCHAFGSRPDGRYAKAWFSSERPTKWMSVQFDASGSVQETFLQPAKESAWEVRWRRAMSRVKWQWRKWFP
jgi:hypothetical protein